MRFRGRACVWTAGLILTLLVLIGCRSSQPEDEVTERNVLVSVDVVPMILEADTSKTATVWVTVMENSEPAPDSTIVNLVTTLGQIESQVCTVDGLAVTDYRAAAQAGVATIIAQVRGVRDTMIVTLY
jgi:hypothetical protein